MMEAAQQRALSELLNYLRAHSPFVRHYQNAYGSVVSLRTLSALSLVW